MLASVLKLCTVALFLMLGTLARNPNFVKDIKWSSACECDLPRTSWPAWFSCEFMNSFILQKLHILFCEKAAVTSWLDTGFIFALRARSYGLIILLLLKKWRPLVLCKTRTSKDDSCSVTLGKVCKMFCYWRAMQLYMYIW